MKARSSGEVFPGGPVVKMPPSKDGGVGGGSIPGWGIKIPLVTRCGQENKGESFKKKKKKTEKRKAKADTAGAPGGTEAGGQGGCTHCGR